MRTINSGREMKLLRGLYADNSLLELSAYMLKVLKDPNLELPPWPPMQPGALRVVLRCAVASRHVTTRTRRGGDRRRISTHWEGDVSCTNGASGSTKEATAQKAWLRAAPTPVIIFSISFCHLSFLVAIRPQ